MASGNPKQSSAKLAFIIGGSVVGAVVILAILFSIFGGLLGRITPDALKVEDPVEIGKAFTGVYLGVDATSMASGNQDAESDVDVDYFKWNEVVKLELADERIVNCDMDEDGKTQTDYKNVWDGKTKSFAITKFCAINYYDMYQGFTAGDSETKFKSEAGAKPVSACSDLFTLEGNSSGHSCQLASGEDYLITISERADTDEEDVVPRAFVITIPTKTTLNLDSIEDGDITIYAEFEYYGEAITSSQTSIEAECDDGDYTPNIGSSLNGVIDSAIGATVTASFTTTCDITMEVKKDGYKVIVLNPISDESIEKGHIKVEPMGYNATTSADGSNVYLTGTSVAYDVDGISAGLIYASLSVCGVEITDNSESDALKEGANEKLRDLGCMKNIKDSETLKIPVKIGATTVIYQTANNSDSYLSTGEHICNISFVGIESTSTDAIGQTLTG